MGIVGTGTLHHTCFLVNDLEKTAKALADTLGIKPWNVFTIEAADCEVRGKKTPITFRVALAALGDSNFELASPVSGDSVYVDHLAKHGEGFHHTCLLYGTHEEMLAAKAELAEQGRVMIQQAAVEGAFEFCYFEIAELGSALELLWIGELPTPDLTIE